MSKVFVSDLFKYTYKEHYDDHDGWLDFYYNFYNYKNFGDQIPLFGRDAPLDTKHLSHIHLARNEEVVQRWSNKSQNNDRTTLINRPELDYWLIYAVDKIENSYLMLSIIGPNAHNREKWTTLYNGYLTDIVEPWISGKTIYEEID